MSALPVFDLTGALPEGTTVLEASAGTGKTYTIAGLVVRYVAEGVARLDQLLVVTFSRAASGELRTRVRERCTAARDLLADPAAARTSSDEVVRLFAGGTDDEVAARRERLADALADFDAATVATTHEFCRQVLHGLGTAADLDPGTVLVESLDDLLVEAVDDLFLRKWAAPGAGEAPLDRRTALRVARAAWNDREARLEPLDAEPGSAAEARVGLAGAVRAEVDRRAAALRVMGFDHLLRRVRDALADEVTGPVARQRLRDRYRVVLVDEFQDTDPVQWEVLKRAFHGHRTLVVIGDPKQAVYAFRGADVRAYLAARAVAGRAATLGTNWRSDPALLDGLRRLLRGAALGDGIVVGPVGAGRTEPAVRPAAPAVRLRLVPRDGGGTGLPAVDAVRDAVAADVAREVVAQLRAGATVVPHDGAARPLQAGDVAVLVRTNKQADLVRDALLAVGVPSVVTGTSSVFATPAAREWLALLEACEQPHRPGRVRRLAVSPFVGRSAVDVDAGGQAATDALALEVRDWAEVLTSRGVAALFDTVAEQHGLAARLLSRPDGERVLTDLRHVAESLHREQLAAQLGLTGLLSWLRGRAGNAGGDADRERSRRLDTDASAVQVVTVHTSKGLEFPVVLVPYGWDAFGGGSGEELPAGHDGTQRTLHVGGKEAPGYGAATRASAVEQGGEELRLLYVAVTRAVSRLVLWWGASRKTAPSPLHRLLLCDDPSAIPVHVAVPDDDAVRAAVRALGLPVEDVVRGPVATLSPPPPATAEVPQAAVFDRALDTGWRRTSYTGLTRALHEAPAVGSEPQVDVKDDEAGVAPVRTAAPGDDALRHVPSPMADLPGGTWFGTLVHAVLEDADLSGGAEVGLRAACAARLAHRPVDLDPDLLAASLLPAVSTPLGPLGGGLRWRDVPRGDLVPEMSFELPLAGGDDPTARVLLGGVADLLDEHLPAGDRCAPYAALLRDPQLAGQVLRGYLTGSLDAVVRLDGPRYVVVDHKTNRLGERGVPLTAWDYRQSALDDAVLAAHYPLQALLYAVALHRVLRWRQPGYDPAAHLGGVLYLFLRGMCGPGVGDPDEPPGVWAWQPPAPLVVAASDLLAGRR